LDQFFDHWDEFVEEHSRVSLCCWGSTFTVSFVRRYWQQTAKKGRSRLLKMGKPILQETLAGYFPANDLQC
jgi:hypothetical protein